MPYESEHQNFEIVRIEERLKKLEASIQKNEGFSAPKIRKLEEGNTAAARIRRIRFPYGESYSIDTHGGLTIVPHTHFPDAATTTHTWGSIIIPVDFVKNAAFPKVKWLWLANTGGNSVDWKVLHMYNYKENDTSPTDCLAESSFTSVSVPSAAATYNVREVTLTTRPEPDSFLNFELTRDGTSDSNNSNVSVYAVWLEYVSFF